MSTRHNFKADHVRPVEVRQLNTPSTWTLPHEHYHSPFFSPGRSSHHLVSHGFLPRVVVAVCLVRDIFFHQQNQVIVVDLHVLDSLGEAKAPDVLDVVSSKVDPWQAGQPAPQWWWHHMESVAAMVESVSESDRNYGTFSSSDSWDLTPQKCAVSPTADPTGVRSSVKKI